MSVKSKNVIEVTNARSRLDSALQDLVHKKEDSADEEPLATVEIEQPVTPPFSPAKRGEGKSSARKRRRREEESDAENCSRRGAYVMKLFDRSIDLSRFSEHTNLYPLCRAWLRNDPHLQYPTVPVDAFTPKHSIPNDDQADVYKLPDPEEGECRDLRIPEPLPRAGDTLDIHADPDHATPPEQLLLQHMARWKVIRHSWLEASRRHEGQYIKSLTLLKSMYDRQMRDTQS